MRSKPQPLNPKSQTLNAQVATLKLQEKGVKKEEVAMLAVITTPLTLVLPALIAKYTSGPNPLGLFM